MTILIVPSSSREYIHIPVAGDYTESMPVHVAIVAAGVEPDADDWNAAAWESGTAKLLIGPGSTFGELDEGTYAAWVRVTASEERPVMRSGTVRIT